MGFRKAKDVKGKGKVEVEVEVEVEAEEEKRTDDTSNTGETCHQPKAGNTSGKDGKSRKHKTKASAAVAVGAFAATPSHQPKAGNASGKDGKSRKHKTKASAAVAVGALAAAPFDSTGVACGATYHSRKWGIRKTKWIKEKTREMSHDELEATSSTPVESSGSGKDQTGDGTNSAKPSTQKKAHENASPAEPSLQNDKTESHSPGSSRRNQNEEESTSTDSESGLTEPEMQKFMKDYAKLNGKFASAVTGIVLSSIMSLAIPSAGVGLAFNIFTFKRSLKKIRQLKREAGEKGINLSELKTDKNTAIILGILIKVSLTAITLGHDDYVSIVTGIDDIIFGPENVPSSLPEFQVDHILSRWFAAAPVDVITEIAGFPQGEVIQFLDLPNIPTWHDVVQDGISTNDVLAVGLAGEVNLVANVLADPLLDHSLSMKRRMSDRESPSRK